MPRAPNKGVREGCQERRFYPTNEGERYPGISLFLTFSIGALLIIWSEVVAFDHVKKLDDMPCKALFAVATGLVFLCQLLAMVLVVNGQVEKAQLRTAQYNATETAIADCSNAHSGPARSHCIDQVNLSLNPHPGYIPAIETRDLNQLAMQGNANTAGLMKTTFTSAQ